jgi:hypothetical protein
MIESSAVGRDISVLKLVVKNQLLATMSGVNIGSGYTAYTGRVLVH